MDYNNIFETALSKLNKEQLEAVLTIEGPVAVVAGPGTGKTQILALRIGNILKQTQVSPANILALTFTENGVLAMKERLVSLIGPAGYDVQIYTFHSFCLRVMEDFPERFAFKAALRPIDEVKQFEIVRSVLESEKFQYLCNPKTGFSNVHEIVKVLNGLKKEGQMPEEIRKYLVENMRDHLDNPLPENANKTKVKAYNDRHRQLVKLEEFLLIYEKYQRFLKENSFCDFADMILYVVHELEVNSDLRLYYQERFQYILADEFQDTNNSQAKILDLLCSYFSEDPNLFVVGDDDQSIYRFQGASIENFNAFFIKYPNAKKIVLKENYRSTQVILDASKSVITNNKYRIEPNKVLNSNSKEVDTGLVLNQYQIEIEELKFLGEEVKYLLDKGVKNKEIAIITRNNGEIIKIAKYFDSLGIVYSLSAGSDVLDNKYVKLIVSLLRVLNDPTDFYEFRKVLFLPNLEVSVEEIMNLNKFLASVRLENIFELPFKEKNGKISSLVSKIADWYKLFNLEPLPNALIDMLSEIGLIEYLGLSLDRLEDFEALNSFIDYVKTFYVNNKQVGVAELIVSLDSIFEHNLKIKEKDFLTADNSIQLMTAHKSKGLEFEYVFMPFVVCKLWDKFRDKNSGIVPSDVVVKTYENEAQAEEESRRLFYVALTRAKKHIYLSYSKLYEGDIKESMKSKFVEEIDKNLLSVFESEPITQQELVEIIIRKPNLNYFAEKEKNMIQDLVSKFELTATSLKDFLTCNKTFFLRHILRIPSKQNYRMLLGTAIHFLIEKNIRKTEIDYDGLGLTLDSLLDRQLINDTEKEYLRAEALETFQYWIENVEEDNLPMDPFLLENSFKANFAGIPIKGKIDMVEMVNKELKQVRVVDFKVKDPVSLNALKGLTESGDSAMYHQLMFYKLLLENEPNLKFEVVQGAIAFITQNASGKVKTVYVDYNDEDFEAFKLLVKESYEGILNLDFLNFEAPCKCRVCEYSYL